MKKFLKWTGIVLGTIILVIVGTYTAVYFHTESRINKTYDIKVAAFDVPTDQETILQGAHYASIKACTHCHGPNLAGKIMIDDPALGRMVAPNITKGKGGLPADFTTEDWLRAIKHGVRKDGKSYFLMPAHELSTLSDSDLRSILAYCQSVPPVESNFPASEIRPLGRILTALDKIPLLPAERLDHTKNHTVNVAAGETPEYGKYLSVGCNNCHHENMQGGEHPVPGKPLVPDISGNSRVAQLSFEEFAKILRTGVASDGHKMSPEDMPWKVTANYNDMELKALHLYLKTVGKNPVVKAKM
ncbi:MAG: cytochrome c [Bacteroidota bacterium]